MLNFVVEDIANPPILAMSNLAIGDCGCTHTSDARSVKVPTLTKSDLVIGDCGCIRTFGVRNAKTDCTKLCTVESRIDSVHDLTHGDVNTKCNHNSGALPLLNPEPDFAPIEPFPWEPPRSPSPAFLKWKAERDAAAKLSEEELFSKNAVVDSTVLANPIVDVSAKSTIDESYVQKHIKIEGRISPCEPRLGRDSVQRSYLSGKIRTSSSGFFRDSSVSYQATDKWRKSYPPCQVVSIGQGDRVNVIVESPTKKVHLGSYGSGDAVNVQFLGAVQGVVKAMKLDLLLPRSDLGEASKFIANPEPQGLFDTMIGTTKVQHEVNMSSELSSAMSTLTGIAQTFVTQVQLTQDTTSIFWQRAKQALWIFGICFAGYIWLRSLKQIEDSKTVSRLIVETLVGVIAGLVGGYFAGREFTELIKRLTNVETQSVGLSALSGVLIAALTYATCGKTLSVATIDKVVSSAGSFEKKTRGIGSVMKWAGGIIEWVVNIVRVHILGYPPMDMFPDEDCEVSSWTTRVLNFLDENKTGKLDICAANAEKLHSLHMEGIAIVSKLRVAGTGAAPLVTKINMFCNLLKTVEQKFAQACVGHTGLRIRPVVILLSGAPGVGKSMVAIPMLNDILSRELTGQDLKDHAADCMNFIYVRQAEHKYWDGYHMRKLAVVFDDFFQQRDVAGIADNEVMDIIRCCSAFPNVLHMADLQSKGVNVFRSHFIVATSNQLAFAPQSIHESEALKRRFDFVVKVIPREQYCLEETLGKNLEDRRVDPSKLSGLNLELYEMHLHKYVGEDQTQLVEVLSYDALVDAIRVLYRERKREFEETCKIMYQRIQDNVKHRMDAQKHLVESKRFSKLDEQFYMPPVVPPDENRYLFDSKIRDSKTGCGPAYQGVYNLASPIGAKDTEMTDNEKLGLQRVSADKQVYVAASGWKTLLPNPEAQGNGPSMLDDGHYFPGSFPEEVNPKRMMSIEEAIMRSRSHLGDLLGDSRLIAAIKTSLDVRHLSMLEHHPSGLSVSQIVSTDVGGFTSILNKRNTLEDDEYSNLMYGALDLQAYRIGKKDVPMPDVQCAKMDIPYWDRFKSAAQEVWDSFKEYLTWVKDFFVKHPIVASLMCVVPIAVGAYGLYKFATCDEADAVIDKLEGKQVVEETLAAENPVEESGHGNRGARHKHKVHKPIRVSQGVIPDVEGGWQDSLESKATALLKKNAYMMHAGVGMNKCGNVIFVTGRLFILNTHYYKLLLECVGNGDLRKMKIECRSVDGNKTIIMPMSTVVAIPPTEEEIARDWMLREAPSNIQPHTNILHHFLTKDDTVSPLTEIELMIVRLGKTFFSCQKGDAHKTSTPVGNPVKFVLENAYAYGIPTEAGDCGSPIFFCGNKSQKMRIVGIHSAGSDMGYNYGTIVYHEDLVEATAVFNKQIVEVQGGVLSGVRFQDPDEALPYAGQFVPIAICVPALNAPTVSKVIESELCGAWGDPTCAPARLVPFVNEENVLVNPRKKAIELYGGSTTLLDADILGKCTNELAAQMMRRSKLITQTCVYDFETAVVGIDGIAFVDSISRSSSPGFPYCLTPDHDNPGKNRFFGKAQEFDLDSDACKQLKTEVLGIIEHAKRGERVLHVFTDNLKDERRKLDKVALGKTRLFSGCPLPLQIATRMYTLAFACNMMTNCVENGVAIGVNVYSHQWTAIVKYLHQVGPHMIAGDFKAFDASLSSQLLVRVLDIINVWYSSSDPEDDMVRRVLWCEVFNSRHITGRHVYEWSHSLPSGHPLTTPINSICGHLLFRYAWEVLSGGNIPFDDHVRAITYGDDNILSVRQEMTPWFNQSTLAQAMYDMGFIYTSETKTALVKDIRFIGEVSFLKRSFRMADGYSGMWDAPLELGVILEIPYWTKDNAQARDITVTNLHFALDELSLHGVETFKVWAPKMLKAARKLGIAGAPDLDAEWKSRLCRVRSQTLIL